MKSRKIVLLLIFSGAVACFFYFDLGRFFTLESLKEHRGSLEALHQRYRFLFVGAYIAVYIVQTALSLPGAAVLTLAGGALFGSVMGTVYVNIGATAGATAAFLVARFLLRDWVLKRFGDRIEKVDRGLTENGLSYLLFLRLVPLFPFWLVNLASGITGLPLRTYVLGTMLGILPGSFVFANAGASLATIESIGGIASPRVIGSFVLLGLFALAPTVYQKIRAKRRGTKDSGKDGIAPGEGSGT